MPRSASDMAHSQHHGVISASFPTRPRLVRCSSRGRIRLEDRSHRLPLQEERRFGGWHGTAARRMGGEVPPLTAFPLVRVLKVGLCKTVGSAYIGSNPTPATS
jgi:hypothetical protein